jgi:hypothetical protein
LNASSRTKFFSYEIKPANVRMDKTYNGWIITVSINSGETDLATTKRQKPREAYCW